MFLNLILIIIGYLSGSIASAVLVSRAMGLDDPRQTGSGNPGATNVLRQHGGKAAALTLAGDVIKGIIPVLIARLMGADEYIVAMTGVAAFIGHIYPVFFGFKGGKGVATFMGVLLASNWLLGLAFIGTWLIVAALFRYSSLSGISAAALTPLYSWLLLPSPAYLFCFCIMAALLIWRHRSNISNLLAGTEDKIGVK